MKELNEFLNAMSAQADALGKSISRIQAERLLVEEAVFNISQQTREKGFIERSINYG